jgi:hypothetical protein
MKEPFSGVGNQVFHSDETPPPVPLGPEHFQADRYLFKCCRSCAFAHVNNGSHQFILPLNPPAVMMPAVVIPVVSTSIVNITYR